LYQPTYSIESPDYIRAVVTGPADDKNILKPTMLKKAGDCTLKRGPRAEREPLYADKVRHYTRQL
jgi:hypothetical protein